MGWRFRKSFKVMPGVRLNLSKRGLSATIGASPLSVGIGQAGVYANASIPGTGLSYRQRLDMPQGPPPPLPPGEPPYAPTEQPPSSPPRMERMTSESLSELRKIMTEIGPPGLDCAPGGGVQLARPSLRCSCPQFTPGQARPLKRKSQSKKAPECSGAFTIPYCS
jgi:hypothetical protein